MFRIVVRVCSQDSSSGATRSRRRAKAMLRIIRYLKGPHVGCQAEEAHRLSFCKYSRCLPMTGFNWREVDAFESEI